MNLKVSVIKNARELAREIVSDPTDSDVAAAVIRVMVQARKKEDPLWPCQIGMRDA